MWQRLLQTSIVGGGGDSDEISVQTFEFDNTVNTATAKQFPFTYTGEALFVVVWGEAYTASGTRDATYDNALVWHKEIPTKALVKYYGGSGMTYGASSVPTSAAGANPTIYSWNGNTVTFRTPNTISSSRSKYKVTVYAT